MHMKRNLTLFLCLVITTGIFAQSLQKPKSSIGFSVGLGDFQTPQDKFKWADPLQRMGSAFSVQYWRGLTPHLDISGTYSGIFLQNMPTTFPDPNAKYYQSLEASLNAKLLKESAIINPFLTAGIGGFNYHKTYGVQAPLGLGLQFNPFHNQAHFLLQAQYKLNITDNNADHLVYSFGMLVPVSKEKEVKVIAPPPPPLPPADTDGDGVIDTQDKCPSTPGLAKYNGCPIPDTDGDGINDELDNCPAVAGLAKYNGCPIPDTDGDGINEEQDKCPTVAGFGRYEGCPIPDTDGDGINDEEDKCPNVAGPADNAGCPVIGIESYKVVFKSASSVLLPEGKKQLDIAVAYLKIHEGFDMMIEGHTDNTGTDKVNDALSAKRAETVKTYLVKTGINAGRLFTQGFGSHNPIEDNKTADGRKHNRRIELKFKK